MGSDISVELGSGRSHSVAKMFGCALGRGVEQIGGASVLGASGRLERYNNNNTEIIKLEILASSRARVVYTVVDTLGELIYNGLRHHDGARRVALPSVLGAKALT